MRQKVSAAIITLNEEKNLPRCLNSIRWVDEMVVVDAGSTDRTVEIAAAAGAKVYQIPWPGYAKQWENAVQLCTNPWVLLMAADEVVDEELAAEIQKALTAPGETRGFIFQSKNFFLGKWMQHCGWYPFPALQLFRKDSFYVYPKAVHESFGVKPAHIVQLTRGHVEHYTYTSLHQYLEKFNRYTDLDALELAKTMPPLTEKDMIKAAFHKFKEMYIEKEGDLDGLHGLVLCVLSALYEFVKIAKYLEIRGDFKNPTDSQ